MALWDQASRLAPEHLSDSDSDEHRASTQAPSSNDVESAIKRDPRLTEAHKQALLAVYRSYVDEPPSQ